MQQESMVTRGSSVLTSPMSSILQMRKRSPKEVNDLSQPFQEHERGG